jgi:hypothetical protein
MADEGFQEVVATDVAADPVPIRDDAGRQVGTAKVEIRADGSAEIEGEITDPDTARAIRGVPLGYAKTVRAQQEAQPPHWWTDPPRDLAEDAREPVADAVERSGGGGAGLFESFGKTGAQFQASMDTIHEALRAAADEEHQLAIRVGLELQAFAEAHQELIVASMRDRAALFERLYHETPRGYIGVETPRSKAMRSILDDIAAGRI